LRTSSTHPQSYISQSACTPPTPTATATRPTTSSTGASVTVSVRSRNRARRAASPGPGTRCSASPRRRCRGPSSASLADDVLEPRAGAVPVEAARHEGLTLARQPFPQGRLADHPFEGPGERADIPTGRHERRLAVHRIVAASAIVEGDEGGAAGHRLHGRHAEPLVPGRAEIDGATAVEPGQLLLGQVLVELVVR